MIPCGHVACGPCLFTAVKTALRMMMDGAMGDEDGPRCPIRRALIHPRMGWKGWLRSVSSTLKTLSV
ncbi:hypothetical protein F5050DRAFT_1786221 [Lentinula boryana]|uniref:Zinc finger C3HC4 RING-type domain-containing protein n=1 Tax=Lentinula boryana TaxID=40481 RepID=A0ABQ8Q288_9AGAR|nr:hypothetical protein F5050DRAFT_1786221 [Lentinula boryana]